MSYYQIEFAFTLFCAEMQSIYTGIQDICVLLNISFTPQTRTLYFTILERNILHLYHFIHLVAFWRKKKLKC